MGFINAILQSKGDDGVSMFFGDFSLFLEIPNSLIRKASNSTFTFSRNFCNFFTITKVDVMMILNFLVIFSKLRFF